MYKSVIANCYLSLEGLKNPKQKMAFKEGKHTKS